MYSRNNHDSNNLWSEKRVSRPNKRYNSPDNVNINNINNHWHDNNRTNFQNDQTHQKFRQSGYVRNSLIDPSSDRYEKRHYKDYNNFSRQRPFGNRYNPPSPERDQQQLSNRAKRRLEKQNFLNSKKQETNLRYALDTGIVTIKKFDSLSLYKNIITQLFDRGHNKIKLEALESAIERLVQVCSIMVSSGIATQTKVKIDYKHAPTQELYTDRDTDCYKKMVHMKVKLEKTEQYAKEIRQKGLGTKDDKQCKPFFRSSNYQGNQKFHGQFENIKHKQNQFQPNQQQKKSSESGFKMVKQTHDKSNPTSNCQTESELLDNNQIKTEDIDSSATNPEQQFSTENKQSQINEETIDSSSTNKLNLLDQSSIYNNKMCPSTTVEDNHDQNCYSDFDEDEFASVNNNCTKLSNQPSIPVAPTFNF